MKSAGDEDVAPPATRYGCGSYARSVVDGDYALYAFRWMYACAAAGLRLRQCLLTQTIHTRRVDDSLEVCRLRMKVSYVKWRMVRTTPKHDGAYDVQEAEVRSHGIAS